MAKEYVFLDEWDVDAPQEAVFNALADARTYPGLVEAGLHRGRGGRAARRGRDDQAALQGQAAVHAEDDLEDRRLRSAHPLPGRGRRRPDRHRQVDPGAERRRQDPRPLRLDRARRPPLPPLPDADHAADLPLEPQLVGGPGQGGIGALRAIHSASRGVRPNSLPGACPRSSRASRASPGTDSSRTATPAPSSRPRARSSGSASPASTPRASSARCSTAAPASGGSDRRG